MTSAPWVQTSLLELISSAEDSPARTCPAQDAARALLASARACGVSLLASSPSFVRTGSLSRMSRAARPNGSTQWSANWKSSAMRVFLSRFRRAMLGLRIAAHDSSLWPTLTVEQRLLSPHMQNAQGGPSLQEVLLPTLTRRDEKGPGPTHMREGSRPPAGSWWASEPDVVPVVHGLSGGLAGRRRRARIRSLGNAVVPQCAEVVGWIIRELMPKGT